MRDRITDVLLDVEVVVDVCARGEPHAQRSLRTLEHARRCGHRVWLSVASVEPLQRATALALRQAAQQGGKALSDEDARGLARQELNRFSASVQWLAALAEDGAVFGDANPGEAQLINAVARLGKTARLLTRNTQLTQRCDQALLVPDYLAIECPAKFPPFVDLQGQLDRVRPQLERNIHRVLHHGRFIMGPEVVELEEALARFVGVKHAIACSSGTDALLMALMAYGVGPGDAVFTTPFTFVATAEVIALLRATPVFADIDPRTFNIDPASLEEAVLRIEGEGVLRPRGILPVDLFGLPADYDALRTIAKAHDLFILEDAAQSFGAIYQGRRAGSLGDAAATSFFPAKPLGCYGDGGAVLTDDDGLADALRSIRIHGQGTDQYDNIRVGLNARADTLQAAVLLAKLQIFPEELAMRQVIARRYTAGLRDAVDTPLTPEGSHSAWSQYSIVTDRRDWLRAALSERGIPTAIYYPKPLHLQRAFAELGYREGDLPLAESVSRRVLSLPMHPYLDEQTQQSMVAAIRSELGSL